MSDLPRRTVRAAPQCSRQHEAGRKAGAEGEVGQVVGAAEHVGAPGGRVEVVLNDDGSAGAIGKPVSEREPVAAEAEVDSMAHGTLAAVDNPGNSDADVRWQSAVQRGSEEVEDARRGAEDPVGARLSVLP